MMCPPVYWLDKHNTSSNKTDETHLADEPEAAGREFLVVDVVAGDGVGVHQVGAALGVDSIEKFQLEVWHEISLFCLEIPYTKKKFISW